MKFVTLLLVSVFALSISLSEANHARHVRSRQLMMSSKSSKKNMKRPSLQSHNKQEEERIGKGGKGKGGKGRSSSSSSSSDDVRESQITNPTPPPQPAPQTAPAQPPVTVVETVIVIQTEPETHCSCDTCTEEVLNTMAGNYTCGARISYLNAAWAANYPTEEDACARVAGIEFPVECAGCDPNLCGSAYKTTLNYPSATRYCGCPECTQAIWESDAQGYSCGARITWLLENDATNHPTPQDACRTISEQFPDSCGLTCNPDTCNNAPIRCGCASCTETAWNFVADGFTCGERIEYLQYDPQFLMTEEQACRSVSKDEFPNVCGPYCDPDQCLRV